MRDNNLNQAYGWNASIQQINTLADQAVFVYTDGRE
jgi:hypothetical protein